MKFQRQTRTLPGAEFEAIRSTIWQRIQPHLPHCSEILSEDDSKIDSFGGNFKTG